jgi:hypothetical protein
LIFLTLSNFQNSFAIYDFSNLKNTIFYIETDGGVFKRFLRLAIAPFQRKVRDSSKKIKKIQFGLPRILLTVTFLKIWNLDCIYR